MAIRNKHMTGPLKTIVITIYDGLISKNILRSDAFKILQTIPHLRIVLLVQPNKVSYFRERFSSANVFVAAAPAPTYPKLDEFFFWVATCSTPSASSWFRIQSYTLFNPLKFFGARLLRLLGQLTWWRRLLNVLYEWAPDRSYETLLQTYQPDLVFVANLISSHDTRLMKAAKQRGIPAVGMVKSWDNIGNKAFVYLHVNVLMVPNEVVRDEAVAFLRVPEDAIRIVGLPQFDSYVDKTRIMLRTEFFKRIGADPEKKLILFAATGREWTPDEPDILEALSKAIERCDIKEPVQVLVRFHPKYENPIDRLSQLPHLICERPGVFATRKLGEWEFEEGDIEHLMNSLYHADVCINTASTMAIESMVFDKPTIGIAFDGLRRLPPHRSVSRFYQFPHNKKLVALGGEEIVHSMPEHITAINRGLRDPAFRAEGRARTRDRECYRLDGKAGERIARVIMDALGVQ